MKNPPLQRWRPLVSAFAFAVIIRSFQAQRALAEGQNHVDFKYEDYKEEGGRGAVSTTSAAFDTALTSSLSMRGGYIYDSISGATPTGGPPLTRGAGVPLVYLKDIRRAENLELSQRLGLWTISPGVSYSKESDYESLGVALNQTFDFNQKNTTLIVGASHDFDRVLPKNPPSVFFPAEADKDTTDGLIGVTQLLGPETVLNANFTFGHAEGYLGDQYRGFYFTNHPDSPGHQTLFGEKRPGYKNREVAYLSLTRFITPANASVELAYRFHHDTFGIFSHTVSLGWIQKIGSRVIIEPDIRYYTQTEASFYHVSLPGDPANSHAPPPPPLYSADYRLSNLSSWTMGLKLRVKVCEYFTIDAAYKRYSMFGNDGVTSSTAYPKANVYTIGASIWF